ncbi:MAG: recombination-associated protein RdgC [Myxococcales bacterium]|nr:recombination-associated protein RdgC [Myxococcales bacterium]MCB9522844.1 recombination-associated protein RdgC [Myxococcales bacterium]
MGAFSGGLSFRQYHVQGDLPANWPEKYQVEIKRLAHKPIDPANEEDRSVGWCNAEFPLDVQLDEQTWHLNEYIVLGMRIDTLAVPGPLLRLHTEAECRKLMAEQKRDSLNRYEKAEVKERVRLAMRAKMMPSIKSIDMVWNWTDGTVRFFASSEKANLEFMELFEDTFGVSLVPDVPYTVALNGRGVTLTEAQKAALENVEPTPFVDADTALAALQG